MSKKKSTEKEVSFWLVKIPQDLLAKVEAKRQLAGHFKKVAIRRMAEAYCASIQTGERVEG